MKREFKKFAALLTALVMVFAMAACGAPEEIEFITVTNGDVIGEGGTEFVLEIVDVDAEPVVITVKTDEETVGGALSALGLIAGEESQFGLYIKTVNGITYDYDKDGKYWGFYIDGTYAVESADLTEITAGSTYTLKAE